MVLVRGDIGVIFDLEFLIFDLEGDRRDTNYTNFH
jgi:hypothetical protein